MTHVKETKLVRDSVTKCFESKHFEEGLKLLKQAESDLPVHVHLECQGNLHFYRREISDAIKDYEAAITIAPDYLIARYQYLVGIKNEKKENFVEAFKRYQYAIEIEPTFVDAYIELGGLLAKADDLEGAAKCYRDAVRLDSADFATWHNLKIILARLKKNDPEKYRHELAEVELICEQLAKAGKTLPERHQW